MSEVKVNKITPTTNCGTVTLGDSGDTFSIPSGVTLDLQGSSSGILDIQWDTTARTSAFTAVAGNGYFVNTTSAAITVTLPASPSAGDFVGIKDYANTADTNNITIARNGSNIQGTANDFTISTEGLSIVLIYVDATQGWVSTGAAKASDIAEQETFIVATGGTITTCGDYKIHTFTSPGTFCVSSIGNPVGGPNNADYLVVAGGGGGGFNGGGGGGAGGNRTSGFGPAPLQGSALPVTATAYPITVGGGGSGCAGGSGGTAGSNSIFSTITSAGGGEGGKLATPGDAGGNGGSGGGGGTAYLSNPAGAGGSGNTPPVSPSQGNNGGAGKAPPGSPNCVLAGGGGGGVIAAGATAGSGSGGAGGAGAPNQISGSCVSYAGGGGGGGYTTGGSGGTGGGGAGGSAGGSATAGTVNTGGGGGGTGSAPTGGAGGSGIVIIRYKYQ